MSRLFDTFPGLRRVFDQTAYVDTRSLTFLHCLVRKIQPNVVLELGTGKGCSTAFMALAIKDGLVVSIDNYLRTDINTPELVSSNLSGCGVLDKVKLIHGETFDAGDLFRKSFASEPSTAEIIFMDASHTASNLHREYESLKSVASENHVIVVDDALYNDIGDFLSELMRGGTYVFYLMLSFHQGVAVLATSIKYLDVISVILSNDENCI